ncbi:hypothetical protein JCM19239_2705 [Vibrio variabilis]|uniref:Mobile element protein n=1 Tax=Vibrio variabilis TaxID=990271 RepID=A0ABQ0JLF2_9VIBR|nr:hypothetical protein JCM19239_2705 [Vibrio variabilis]
MNIKRRVQRTKLERLFAVAKYELAEGGYYYVARSTFMQKLLKLAA